MNNIDNTINLNEHDQRKLKDLLDEFYGQIYVVRLGIEIHREIGNAISMNKNIQNNNYWGFFQSHENIRACVLGMFRIFDKRKDALTKQLLRFLKSRSIAILSEKDMEKWEKILAKHKGFRDKRIAHYGLENAIMRFSSTRQTIFTDFKSIYQYLSVYHNTSLLYLKVDKNAIK